MGGKRMTEGEELRLRDTCLPNGTQIVSIYTIKFVSNLALPLQGTSEENRHGRSLDLIRALCPYLILIMIEKGFFAHIYTDLDLDTGSLPKSIWILDLYRALCPIYTLPWLIITSCQNLRGLFAYWYLTGFLLKISLFMIILCVLDEIGRLFATLNGLANPSSQISPVLRPKILILWYAGETSCAEPE